MNIDRNLLRKYFTNLSIWFYIFCFMGVLVISLMILTYQYEGDALILCGGALIVLVAFGSASWIFYNHFHLRPDEKTVGRVIGEDLEQYRRVAIAMLGLTDEEVIGNYIYLWGPCYEDISLVESGLVFKPLHFRKGKDGLYRFTSYRVMVLVPTARCLGVFRCMHSLLENRYWENETGEYYYRDVVSIRTLENRSLTLTFTDGNDFWINIPSDEVARKLYQSHHVPFVPFARAVQSIRKMIQFHKDGGPRETL